MTHTKTTLIKAIQDYYTKHNTIPSYNTKSPDLPHIRVYTYHFKTWNNAIALAGFKSDGERKIEKGIRYCKHCEKRINKKSARVFCNSSCAAKFNNLHKTHGTRRSYLERYVEKHLPTDFPQLEILFNKKSAIGSELDVYIPSLNLAIEINGIMHYKPIHGEDKLKSIQEMDKRKAVECKRKGIKLVSINTTNHTVINDVTCKPYYQTIKKHILKHQSKSTSTLVK